MMYCDVPIGKDTTGNFTLSYKGVAVRSDCNRFIAFRSSLTKEKVDELKKAKKPEEHCLTKKVDPPKLYDVTGLTLPGCDALIYRVPVRPSYVCAGQLILVSDCPFQVLYVTEAPPNDDYARVRGFTASGEEITYIAPTRLGDCAQFIRIFTVFDACGISAEDMNEDQIAFIAALLCCQPRNAGFGAEIMSSTLAQSMLGVTGKLPLLLALQQSQCLESYILTRALQKTIDDPIKELPGAPVVIVQQPIPAPAPPPAGGAPA